MHQINHMPCARENLKLFQVSGCLSKWHRRIGQYESLPQSFRSDPCSHKGFVKN